MTLKKSPPESGAGVTLRQRALNWLARREYSHAELARRLAAFCDNPDEIAALLGDFAQRGWISDERYAAHKVQQRGDQFGARRIRHELREQGLSGEVIDAALAGSEHDEFATAQALWRKKFGVPPADQKEKARQIRFLAARGFAMQVIFQVVASGGDDDELSEY